MTNRCAVGLIVAAWLSAAHNAVGQSIPAFSGAEGPGANATGGRGGDVYHVTKLDFDLDGVSEGSLKYGINTAPAAGRTIVFDVGGTIFHNGGGSQWWFRSGKSNITIAGQTAPGGITIAGVGSKFTGDNIILRNITVRTNQDPVNPTSFTYDGISTQATNSIIDHVSVSWFSDEGISATDAVNNTTVQYATMGEGLNYNGHSYGSIINTQNSGAPIGYHHNLYAHNNSRNPRLGSETGTGAITNFYNNVIYNWISRAGYSALNTDSGAQEPSRTNFINNFYLKGASNGSTIFQSAGDATQIYQIGNLYDSTRDADYNDGAAVTWTNFNGTETQLASPLVVAAGVIDSATMARDRTLDYGGANWWNRHPIEARIVTGVRNGTGAIINTAPTTEWNDVVNAPLQERGDNYDVDQDGMPDVWELAHGLNPNLADNNGDFDGDGYRNVEEYINEVAEWPAPQPIVFNGATNNRYAQIANWDIKWQPSKFDEAQINGGTVVVDAVGQHAKTLKIGSNSGDVAQLNVTGGWLIAATEVKIGAAAGAQGTLNLSGGMLATPLLSRDAGGTFNFTGGVLSAGTVGFTLENQGGVIAPGASPGSTHVVGDLVMTSGSIAIELAGTQPGQFNELQIDGALHAGGTLTIELLPGYTPGAGDAFDLFDFSSTTGSLTLDLPALGVGQAWDVSDLLVSGELRVTDVNFDGDSDVDGEDFLAWQRGFGLSGPDYHSQGDANGDYSIDGEDMATWGQMFGVASTAAAEAQSVPEPSSLMLAFLIFSYATLAPRTPRTLP